MIYTRYGSEVEIVKTATMVNGILILKRIADDKELQFTANELRADGGFREIDEAINALTRGRE